MKGQLHMRTDSKKSSVANGRRGGSQLPGINRDAVDVGDIAGILALQGVRSRVHSCIATVHSQLLVIDVDVFLNISNKSASFKEKYESLQKTAMLKDWPVDRMFYFAFNWEEVSYEKGNVITDLLFYPVLLFSFLPRLWQYKSYFKA